MKFFNLTLFTVFVTFLSSAQLTEREVQLMVANRNTSEAQLVVESSRMLQENYYYFSEICVDKLLEINPESSNYNYRKAFIALDTRHDYKTALPMLEKAVKNISKNYDMYSVKETGAPVDALYHMARCYHWSNNIDKAEEYYNLFIENSNKKSELVKQATLKLEQCKVARYEIANPKSAIVKNVGEVINTDLPEYSPVVSLDGQSLYFTSRRDWENGLSDRYKDPMLNQFPEDIFVSYMDFDGNWTEPFKLDFCNDSINEATIAVSTDERRIYVYEDVTGMGDVYYSDFKRNEFQTLEELPYEGVNTRFWETHCTVTPDGREMYFVSERPEGFGGRDIYRIVKLPNGTWSEPINLGPGINTPYDEDSPFFAIDNKTMYYGSNGPKSMGGFDIFVTVKDEQNNWSEPINLGYPINSTDDDLFYTTTVDGLKGYLTSWREDGFGEKDIYEIQNDYMGVKNVVVLKGRIRYIDGAQISEDAYVSVRCLNCPDGQNQEVLPRLRDGAFLTSLIACKDYEIIFYEHPNDEVKREKFTTACNAGYEEIYKEAVIGQYYLAGTVADRKTAEFLKDSKVEFIDPTTNEVVETLTTDVNGAFTSNLLEDKNYGDVITYNVRVSHESYLTETFKLNETLGNKSQINLAYLIEKLEIGSDIGKIIEINPIYFDLDKSNIRPDAAAELDKIVTIMNENPNIVIELGSHTDCRASKSYNMSLSDRRAKSSAKYIQARIDNPKRIYGKGFGESQLVNDCGCEGDVVSDCSEEEHQANRRTEFKIVKM